jgi:hypothetical protein
MTEPEPPELYLLPPDAGGARESASRAGARAGLPEANALPNLESGGRSWLLVALPQAQSPNGVEGSAIAL